MDIVCQKQVQLFHRDSDVVGLNAERWVSAVRGLDQTLAVCALQRNPFKQDDHDQVQPPHFVSLPQAVDSPDLALLVGVGVNAARVLFARYAEHKVFPVLLPDVLAQLGQETGRPFLLDFGFLAEQLVFHCAFFVLGHPLFMLLEVLAFPCLQVEPGVGYGTHMREQRLDEGMKFILRREKEREGNRKKLAGAEVTFWHEFSSEFANGLRGQKQSRKMFLKTLRTKAVYKKLIVNKSDHLMIQKKKRMQI